MWSFANKDMRPMAPARFFRTENPRPRKTTEVGNFHIPHWQALPSCGTAFLVDTLLWQVLVITQWHQLRTQLLVLLSEGKRAAKPEGLFLDSSLDVNLAAKAACRIPAPAFRLQSHPAGHPRKSSKRGPTPAVLVGDRRSRLGSRISARTAHRHG